MRQVGTGHCSDQLHLRLHLLLAHIEVLHLLCLLFSLETLCTHKQRHSVCKYLPTYVRMYVRTLIQMDTGIAE